MFNDRDVLVTYRLLEYPNETAQSWPIARHERGALPLPLPRLVALARDAGRRAGRAAKIAA